LTLALLGVGGCKVLDMLGLAHVVTDVAPQYVPCNYTGFQRPCLKPDLADTVIMVGDTETVNPLVWITPINAFSKPDGILVDTSRHLVSYDTSVVTVHGLQLMARGPGTDSVVMTGNYGIFPLYWKVFITVLPRQTSR
jgi:hypothetical protein